MKAALRLLAVAACCAASNFAFADGEVSVSASRAVRIALVDTQVRTGTAPELEAALALHFSRTVSQIHGAQTAVEFAHVTSPAAAAGLKTGRYDSAVILGARVPGEIRRLGLHVLKAESTSEKGGTAAALVLCKADASLDELLANAFSLAVDDAAVRKVLTERLRGAPTVASVSR